MNVQDEIKKNPILNEVFDLFLTQTSKGLEKYGTTVNPDDYSLVEWIDHALQEKVDEIVYLTTVKHKIMEELEKESRHGNYVLVKHTPEQFLELRRKGYTLTEIADAFCISEDKLYRWRKEHNLVLSRKGN